MLLCVSCMLLCVAVRTVEEEKGSRKNVRFVRQQATVPHDKQFHTQNGRNSMPKILEDTILTQTSSE